VEIYQIFESVGKCDHAGSKAVNDIKDIAEKMEFKNLCIKNRSFGKQSFLTRSLNQISCFFYWLCVYLKIKKTSIVFVQWPFRRRQLGYSFVLKNLARIKKCKLIGMVHDVEELRTIYFNKHAKKDFELMCSISDILIVHNEKMKDFFISKGITEDKLITLKLFDYLTDIKKDFISTFSKKVIIAGNLAYSKSPYLSKLPMVKNVSFQLYGPNIEQELLNSKNIEYMGSVDPNVLPQHLNSGFGLVWDGESVDTCSGYTGKYLRYNNPHKLSLYIASGLPVVIWSEAAEASFVIKYDIGITINSFNDLSNKLQKMSKCEYEKYAINVSLLAPKVKCGEFTIMAISDAIDNIGNK